MQLTKVILIPFLMATMAAAIAPPEPVEAVEERDLVKPQCDKRCDRKRPRCRRGWKATKQGRCWRCCRGKLVAEEEEMEE